MDDFEDFEFYLDALAEIPEDLEIFAKILEEAPKGWTEHGGKEFIPFPEGGALCLYTKLPSSNHSKKDKYVNVSFS